jgi:hypothetical protein
MARKLNIPETARVSLWKEENGEKRCYFCGKKALYAGRAKYRDLKTSPLPCSCSLAKTASQHNKRAAEIIDCINDWRMNSCLSVLSGDEMIAAMTGLNLWIRDSVHLNYEYPLDCEYIDIKIRVGLQILNEKISSKDALLRYTLHHHFGEQLKQATAKVLQRLAPIDVNNFDEWRIASIVVMDEIRREFNIPTVKFTVKY